MGWSEPKKFRVEKFNLGSKTATSNTVSYNIATLIANGTLPKTIDYTKLTKNDFVVGIVGASKTTITHNIWQIATPQAISGGFTLATDYTASTGVLKITGIRQKITANDTQGGGSTDAYQYMKVQACLVC